MENEEWSSDFQGARVGMDERIKSIANEKQEESDPEIIEQLSCTAMTFVFRTALWC